MKKITKVILFFIVFFSSTRLISAQELPQAVFLNHIRGDECCNEGSYDLFLEQVNFFKKNNLPATFALRYDILIDQKYQQKLTELKNNQLLNFGVMIEITPQLATDAGVEYKGNKTDWHKAQYAFTIGYSSTEKKKILDTLVKAYKNIFNKYPEVSTAWITDTESLNYLKDNYGLKIHQIAREQIGLDSYTLDGGPPHYPYSADNNWFFVPNKNSDSSLLILRHTVADPLYEYGDQTSAFTSQANDYVLDGKDFSYFKKLIDQALFNQSTRGFINLGLENSMQQASHDEFFKQVEYIKNLEQNQQLSIDSIDDLPSYWANQPITIYQGNDLINNQEQEAFWITTPSYRIRLRKNKNNLFIDDLRIYQNLTDPYKQLTAISSGYLIVPSIFKNNENFNQQQQSFLKELLFKDKILKVITTNPKNDLSEKNIGLVLPSIKDSEKIEINQKNNQFSFSYQNSNDQNIELIFDLDKFSIKGIEEPKFNINKNFNELIRRGNQLLWPNQDFINLTWECETSNCNFFVKNNSDNYATTINHYQKYLMPDPGLNQADLKTSQIFLDNDSALANINPIRLVFSINNANYLPATLQIAPSITTKEPVDKIEVIGDPLTDHIFYIDIYNQEPLETELQISFSDIEKKITKKITFAPLCNKDPEYCLTHPKQTVWYLKNKIKEKIKSLRSKL